ncbi:MBG domain-containing protein [Flavobacterium sp. NG2]|uniref:MBG domain-containing protein n=1 Tax=Flavobacterium sp. NG2 TaxID=3097547 RepID=UPI002A80CBE8|nr:MBG domain-containing protein [Flavobacterium sp. NG2]WPR70278.1 MBG domain-containing protein [Flavobacterium sp. NG2]
MTVNAKALLITANNQSKTYGETKVLGTTAFTAPALESFDAITGVSLSSTGSVNTATVAGSTYPIVASAATGTGLGNYTITYADGALTVNAKALLITANNQSKTYGETKVLGTTAFTAPALESFDAITGVSLSSTGSVNTATVAGSTYPIVASAATGTGLGNYTITYADGALTVNAKALLITANNQSKTYGETKVLGTTAFTAPALESFDAITGVSLSSTGSVNTATVAGSTYPIVASAATGTGLGNYTITYADGALTVNAKALLITANNQSKTYGETKVLGTTAFTAPALESFDAITGVSLSSTGSVNTATVAGSTYPIVASAATGTGLGNYTITYADGALTVNAKALLITANNQSKTYGETKVLGTTAFTAPALESFDAITGVSLSSTGSVNTATVAGSTYPIVASAATGTGLGNYTITYADGALTVNAKALLITANNQSKTYGETKVLGTTAFTAPALESFDAITGVSLSSTGSVNTATVAGSTYPIVASAATGTGLGNYTITYADGALTVNAKALLITANNQSKTYGETKVLGTTAFTAPALESFDAITGVSLSSTGSVNTATVAGSTYPIVASAATGTGLGNYTITYADGALTVNAKALLITANNQSKTYGETKVLGTTAFTAPALESFDAITGVSLSSTGSVNTATVAGSTYPIVASAATGTGLGNYTITYADGALTVNAKALLITANNQSKTYGETKVLGTTAFTAPALESFDAITGVSLSSTGSVNTATVAGSTYPIVASAATGTGLGNYTITYADGALTVNAKALLITANNQSKTYGETKVLGTTAFTAPALESFDAITGVSLSSTGSVNTATVAGSTYPIVASAATGTGLGNYTITYADGALTVNAKALLITANNQSKTYGETKVLGTTAFTAPALESFDAITGVSLSSTGSVNTATVAGSTYPIVASAATGTGLGNYTITYADGALTVNAKALLITANNQSKTYGETKVLGTTAFTAPALESFDAITGVSLSSTGSVNTATVAGSTYPIVASAATGTGLGNYTITYADGALTVNAKALLITANNQSKTYGETKVLGTTAFTAPALESFDAITGVSLSSTGSVNTATVAGSTYPIVASAATGTGLGNYTITYADGALTVNAKALLISATGINKVYDGNTIATVSLSDNRFSWDALTLTTAYTTANFANENIGTWNVSVTGISISGVSAGNYNLVNTIASTSATISTSPTSITTIVLPNPVQYSDKVTMVASVTSATAQAQLNAHGGTVEFKLKSSGGIVTSLGTSLLSDFNNSDGTVSKQFTMLYAPGTYTIIAVFSPATTNFTGVTNWNCGSLTIIQEDARAEFTGTDIVATQSASSSIAVIELRATIQDITATSEASGDADFGDIRKAKVRFLNDNVPIVIDGLTDINGWVLNPIALVNASDTKTGTISVSWPVNIGSMTSMDYTIGIEVGGYYKRNSSEDNVVITVYKPTGDFITGGGYIVPTQSAGSYASDAGRKTNFGFNVKYNKSGKSLQGNMNFIFRRTVAGVVKVYQVKSNAMQSLGVNISNASAKTAVFVSKCNLKDITDPVNPISLGGGLLMQVNMVDKGEPGNMDEIGFSLYDGNTLLYSSNWVSSNTIKKILSGGNLVVHSGFSVGTVTSKVDFSKSELIEEGEVDNQKVELNVVAYPIPTNDVFNIEIQGANNDSNVSIRIVDMLGKLIYTTTGNNVQNYSFGNHFPSGTYIMQVIVDSKIFTSKIIKN